MSNREKQVLALIEEGLPFSVVAARMGITKGAVSGIVRRSGREPESRTYDRRLLRACKLLDDGLTDSEVAQKARVRVEAVADLRKELGALDGLQ